MECVDFNDVCNKHFIVSSTKDLHENVEARNIIDFITVCRVCIAHTMPSQDVRLSVRPSVSHAGIESKRLYTSSKLFTV